MDYVLLFQSVLIAVVDGSVDVAFLSTDVTVIVSQWFGHRIKTLTS